jgi:hypothetical protein
MAKLYNENYIEVKRKLDGLNYLLPFDMTSCKLVETLISDVYRLKEDLTKSLTEKETLKQKFEHSDLNSRASEFESKRILKENQQLHKEMIELSKKLNFSGSAKDIEIKRLFEEKNDLKFLLNETKNKLKNLEKETVKLKTRLSDMLVKIFDSNFSENNLRNLFNEHVFLEVKEGNLTTENDNLFDLNYELISQERKKKENPEEITIAKTTNNQPQMLEITLPKRTINMTQVLEPNYGFEQARISGSNQYNNSGGYNQSASQQQMPYVQSSNLENAMNNTFLKTADELIVKASYSGTNNEGDINKNLTKKNEILLKQVDKLTAKLNEKEKQAMIMTKELEGNYKGTSSTRIINDTQNETVIKYLKEENSKLTAKYEERINFIIKENRALQDAISEMSVSLKKKVVKKVAVNNDVYNYTKLEKKAKQLEFENKTLKGEISFLREKIERNEKSIDISKFVPKEFLSIVEEKNSKMKDDYEKSQELILKLNEKIQNLLSSSNSEKVFLKNSLKNLSLQDDVKTSEKNNLLGKMSRIEDEKNELSENINNLNSLLSQKENTINKLNDFINNFKQDFESVKNEKDLAISKVVQLERDFTLLRRNINLKEGEIDKLNNINTIYERENEILKMRLGK